MSEDNITLTYFAIMAKINGSEHYFKWNKQGDLCTDLGLKGAAYFKRREAERTIINLQKNNFPHPLKMIAIK